FLAERFQVNGNSESRTRGQLRFRSLADLLAFRVRDLQGASFDSDFIRGYRQTLFGIYLQDQFKATSRLTLNWGVRYEKATTPHEVNKKVSNLRDLADTRVTVGDPLFQPTSHKVAPRLGFAYDVFADGKRAVRGGFGVFYDQPLFNIFRNPIFRTPPFVNRGRLTAAQVPALPVSSDLFRGVDQAAEVIQFRLVPSYALQYNLNVQRELWGRTVVSLAYVGSRGINIFGMCDVDTAVPVILADGRAFFPEGSTRRNPNFDIVRSVYQGFSSSYNGANVGVGKRFSQGFQFQTSYTFGKSID